MSFQTDDLSLLTLGIQGDQPPDADQPPLRDGIHCRWLFAPERGFPWHGFYLFRRESTPREPRCLGPELLRFRPGLFNGLSLETPLGRLSSAKPLVFTEEFPPAGTVEVDLNQGAMLRFDLPAGVEARRVDVRIGLRSAASATARTCVDFRAFPVGSGPSPRTEKGAVFTTEPPPVSPQFASTTIVRWSASLQGLLTTRQLTIAIPCPATSVDLLLTSRMDLAVEILAADGKSLGVKSFVSGALQLGSVTLTGPAIAKVVLTGPSIDSALLHQICWECPTSGGGKGAPIEVAVLAGTTVAAQTVVRGDAGQVVAATLAGTGITAVQVNLGNAALVDLCVWPSQQGVTFGWSEVPGFTYPLCLPVAHPDYPCPGKPADFSAAQALALSRVTYPAPVGWDQGFLDLHGELQALVQGGPTAEAMAVRKHPNLLGHPLSPATQANVPSIPANPGLHPLELVLLASLQPAVAQMLGLYFVDTAAAAGVAYDYLLLADPTGVLGGSAANALAWLASAPDPDQVDAVLVTGHSVQPRAPIAPPGPGKAYALPGPSARQMDGTLPEAVGGVGLWWPLPPDSDQENPDQLVFYYPRRASLGADPNPDPPVTPPADSAYQPLADPSPVLVSEPDPPDPPVPPNPRSSDWPPPSIPLYLVDGNLPEGWYSYRFIGQDLFGRHSPLGPPTEWIEWVPSEHQRHPFAVALLDKIPPPAPLGVEAWALDPLDRWVLADDTYTTWRKANPDLVGLRVRWRWAYLQHLQARDTREFRLYYQPGRWNARLGRIVKVTAAAKESDVDLDLSDTHAVNAFAGARLRVGNDDFAILGSQPGAQLRLRVKNIGVHDEIPPTQGKPCTVAIPETHPLWVDTSLAASWAQRLAVVPYDPPVDTVFDPSKDPNDQALTSHNDAFKTVQVTVTGQDALFGAGPDLSGLQPWIDHLWLQAGTASEAHRVVRYDNTARTVTLESAPALTGPFDSWVLGRPTREYEIFLPAPDVGAGHPFEPSLAEPAVYAQIAVSAADDKKHVADDPKWNDPARFGNESRLSPSATVFRVLQTPPAAPDLPDLGERLTATPADYASRSYSTFRFNDPGAPLRVHILRAVDDSLFQRDWLIRETRKALDPANAKHSDFFPDGLDAGQRTAAAVDLNALATGAPYSGLSNDAWAVLALLPGNEGQPNKTALEARDELLRRLRGQLAATDGVFPPTWNAATRTQAAGSLNGIARPADYASLPDNALRVLAGLPGNEAAFTQITLAPLEMADPRIKDERRPDDDAAYAAQPALRRAYTDTTLSGRANNLYFYRARFVDGAQNQSSLSLAGPPVYLRKVEPPRTPVITKMAGGDRKITIWWAPNREPDISFYQVYRTVSEADSQDLRRMEFIGQRSHDPALFSELSWVDEPVPGATPFFYRVVVVDISGQVAASAPASMRAFDTFRPAAPQWEPVVVDPGSGNVTLAWSSLLSDLACNVERRAVGTNDWRSITGWLKRGMYKAVDSWRTFGGAYDYRLRAVDGAGRSAPVSSVLTV